MLIAKTFGCVRFIYNKMLGDKIEHYKETNQKFKNTPTQYKKEFEWLKEVDSLALANAQMNLQIAYNNFFRKPKIGFPKFKSKRNNKKSYTTNFVNGNIKLENACIVLPKLKGVKIKQHRAIAKDYILKAVTGKYFASILYEYELDIKQVQPEIFLGLDFYAKELFVSSDKTSAEYPRYYRQSLEKLKREQRKLSLCQKGSKNRNKQKIKVAKIYEKVTKQRKDFLHKQSKQISNAIDVVCIEDLNMRVCHRD